MVNEIKKGGWKNWPRWVKGGVIGLVLAIILSVYILVFRFQCVGLSQDGTSSCPTGFEAFNKGLEVTHPFLLFSMFSLIFIGALIGLLIGKIKSLKNKNG